MLALVCELSLYAVQIYIARTKIILKLSVSGCPWKMINMHNQSHINRLYRVIYLIKVDRRGSIAIDLSLLFLVDQRSTIYSD